MRIWIVSGVAAAALGAVATGALGMASGGGGGGGTYGGGMSGGSGPSDYSIAVRLIKHDKCGDALPHLNKALEKKPRNADVLNYLGYCQRKIGNYQYSLDYYNRALAIDPEHRGAHEYLGELYLNMNKPDDAAKQLATLSTLCPRGCEEKDTLEKSIAAYQAKTPATAPAAATPGQQ